MSYALCPKLKKNVRFLPLEWDRDFNSSVFCTPAAKCFFLRRLTGARHISPAFVWTLPKGWPEPLTSAPCADFMTPSLFFPIDVWGGLGSPTNVWVGFHETSSGLLPGNYIPRELSRSVLKLPSTAKTPGSIHYYLPGRCNHASVQSSTFFGPLDRRETFNSGVFFFSKNRRWKDLQLAQSYGELRVPLLDHMKVTISVSFWIFFALLWTATSSQTQQLKKTNCRLFIL